MSRLMWVKLWRDLRAGWSRFALMVVAITVSLILFGGVLFAWAAVGRETRGAYMGTEPASATIVLQEGLDVDEMAEIAAEVRSWPEVIEATGRTQFITRVEVNANPKEIPLQVFVTAPDDSLRLARFYVEDGDWPAGRGEIFLGSDSLGLLDAVLGDTVTVTTPDGEPVELRVADTVYDPSLSPSPQEQTARGYLSTTALAASGDDVLDQLKFQVADPGESVPARDRDAIVDVAGEIGQWLQVEKGLAVAEIQVPEPYTHPHQFQADSLLLSLLAGAGAALILSAILVANMLNTLFTQQTPQIGIIKAVGARSGRITRFYLTMTLLVAAVATLLALGPAALIGRAGLQQFLGFLGIEPASVAPPAWAYLIVLSVGLCLLPAMALVPITKASRTTVRAAIDYHGLGGEPNTSTGVLARITRLGSLDRRLLLALRNTFRRPARFWLSAGLLASGGVVFVAGMSLGSSVAALGEEQREQRNWDVEVQLAALSPTEQVVAVAEQTPDVVDVEGWAGVAVGVAGPGEIPLTGTYPDQGHGRTSLVAIPSDSSALPSPELLEGRWLNAGETGAVVINQITENNTVPEIAPGDTVQLLAGGQPTTWTVVGIVEERAAHSAIYTTSEGFAAAIAGAPMVNQLRVITSRHDETTRESVAASLEESLTDQEVKVGSSVSVSRSEEITEGHLGPIIAIILTIAIAMGVVGGIGLASTMTANVLDRIREFGVMHAVGARPKTVRRIVITEGVILALTSVVIAVVPALVLTAILGAGLGNLFIEAALPYRISTLAIVIWLVLITFGAALATDTAANRASRLTVREALSYL
jgi:putative ABC transport system permease protein